VRFVRFHLVGYFDLVIRNETRTVLHFWNSHEETASVNLGVLHKMVCQAVQVGKNLISVSQLFLVLGAFRLFFFSDKNNFIEQRNRADYNRQKILVGQYRLSKKH